jgi:3,4-dihydroxy 2-butanone 4-phosphate synthase / GTP cyclohydrolase II
MSFDKAVGSSKLKMGEAGAMPSASISSVEAIVEEARNGRMFILVDDANDGAQGCLVLPAQMATPDAVNFMATHGRGLVCLALTRERIAVLGLDLMVAQGQQKPRNDTAYTVSIEARDGVSTGISAADRARTIAVAISTTDQAALVTPGHVFPVIVRDGGVLVRAGIEEAAVDISRLAGLNESSVFCQILQQDGEVADLAAISALASSQGLLIGTVSDLIAYRHRFDHLVECVDEDVFQSNYGGNWVMRTYVNKVDGSHNLVLKKGDLDPDQPILVRMHGMSVFADVLGQPGDRHRLLQRTMEQIGAAGAGIIVLLMPAGGARHRDVRSGMGPEVEIDLRSYGIGAQILADLGVQKMMLLTNSTKHVIGLEGFGLEICGNQSIS